MSAPLPRVPPVANLAAAELLHARADAICWRPGVARGGVEVGWGCLPGELVPTYRVVTHHPRPRAELVDWLGPGLLSAFALLNRHFHRGELLETAPPAVRTAFALPWPLAPREFVHGLSVTPLDERTTIVAYHPLERPALARLGPGWIRAQMLPSGQRVRATPQGCTVEHVMGYALGGRISPWAQRHLLHRAHLRAYMAEWAPLVRLTRSPGPLPGAEAPR